MKRRLLKIISFVMAVILSVTALPAAPLAVSSDFEIYHYETGEAGENGYAESYLVNDSGERVTLEDAALENASVVLYTAGAEDYALPESYDARDYGYITSVKNQQSGTCWAHAATACLEASYLKQGLTGIENPDFSEMHIAWSFYFQNTDNTDDPACGDGANQTTMPLEIGGNEQAALSVLARWSGAANQADYPQKSTAYLTRQHYMKNMTYADRYAAAVHLENFVELPDSVAEIKQAIIDNGAVCVSYMSAGKNYPYYYTDGEIDHSILVVGWDDSISADEFDESGRPSRDGAWLCKNSWGTAHGDGGYFWMSYDQTPISKFFYYSADADFYDNNYQYCGSTPSFYETVSNQAVASANVFTANGDEMLEAVGAYLPVRDTDYTVEIYTDLPEGYADPVTDGTLAATVSGNKEHSGYYTIELESPVALSEGEIFSVVLSTNSAWTSSRFIAIGNKYYEHYEENRGFILRSGTWKDAASLVSNDVYLRAFTTDVPAEGGFTVNFNSCEGEALATAVSDEKGSVTLPDAPEGYVYEFTLDGAEFSGRGVTEDITVSVHCWSPDNTVTEECRINTLCEFCGKKLDDAAEHDFEDTVIFDWGCARTESFCTRCGYYKTAFDFPPDTRNGIIDDHTAWYLEIETGEFYIVGRGEIAGSNAAAATAAHGWADYLNGIRSCHIGNEITSLPKNFLYGAKNLTSVEILGNLTEIPEGAFASCTGLKSVELPPTLRRISANAFNLTALTSVYIPPKVEYIGNSAFANCYSLESVYGLAGISKIGKMVFSASIISGKINLPASLEYFGYGAFSSTKNLEGIEIDPDCTAYKSYSGKYILTADGTELVYYSSTAADEVFAVPESVKTVGDYTFMKNLNLKYIELPNVTAVGESAFGSTALRGVGFGSSEDITIGYYAFRGSDNITAMYLPSNVTSILTYAIGFTEKQKVNSAFTLYCESGSQAEAVAERYGLAYSVEHAEHDIERIPIVEATCLADGTRYGLCSVCGHVDRACEDYSVNDEHAYERINDTDPTCTETGIAHGVCIHCGFEGEHGTVVPANGHSFEWLTDIAATCEETGVEHEECTGCGLKRSEETEIPATGHSHEWVIDVKMTCGADGLKHEECTVCGHIQSENTVIVSTEQHPLFRPNWYGCRPYGLVYGSKVCVDCGTVVSGDERIIKDTPHTYELTVTVEATCTESGIEQYVCKYCGDAQPETYEIAATGHSFWNMVVIKEANCVETGMKAYKCETCGVISPDGQKMIPVSGTHTYEWVTDAAATCISEGAKHEECVHCGAIGEENAAVELTDCSYEWVTDKEAGCTSAGVKHKQCTVCGSVTSENTEIAQLAHTYEWVVDLAPACGTKGIRHQQCTGCGEIINQNTITSSTGEHVYEWVTDREPTCAAEGAMHQHCTQCNSVAMRNTAIPVVDHIIGGWEYSENGIFVKKCGGCGMISEQTAVGLSFAVSKIEVENASGFSAEAAVTGLDGLKVKYTSSNEKIITVDRVGNAKAVGTGTAQITANIENTDITATLSVTVVPREFTVTWMVEGVATRQKIKEGAALTAPENPQAENLYFAGWSPAVPEIMPPHDLVFTAVFREYDVSKISLSVSAPSIVTLSYGESVKLYATAKGLPEGAIIKWYVKGKGVSIETSVTGRICTVTSTSTGDAVVHAYVAEAGGKAILDLNGERITDSQPIQSEANLWLRILHFFRQLFPALQKLNRLI